MPDWKLSLYHHMPPFMRNAAATWRGYQLRSWRYGPETEQLVEEALERDHWSPEQWKTYQENRLGYILHRAATQVPYYRDQWAERRRNGDHASWEYLENWPILKKPPLRENSVAFVAEDCNLKQMYINNTSGTTGTPLKLFIDRKNLRHWYALFEARWRHWYGLSRHENWGILGGQAVVPAESQHPPFWVWNRAMKQLYLSANHVSIQNARSYLAALRDYKITHLVVYTSSATFLAEQILKLEVSINLPDLRAIITNAEPLFDWQRDILAKAFLCEIHETYGMGEMIVGASADNQRRLRLWPEPGYLEILDADEDRQATRGEVGRLIATSLLNSDMPLIRYEVGDRSGFSTEQPAPEDLFQNPILLPIQGRNVDMLVARDGRQVFWVNPIFYKLPVVEAQIIQESIDDVTIRYVPAGIFDQTTLKEIEKRLITRMGDVAVTFEEMEKIPRGPNGKFRAVICNLSPEERARVLQ